MKIKEALEIVGSLSAPTKMPGYCFSLPASACKTGAKLRKKPGTVCSKCYACKGRYVFQNVQNAQQRRLQLIDSPGWVDAMVELVRHYGRREPYFRWFSSGDIQSFKHLKNIVNVARRTPDVLHWLPTKETKLIKFARKRGMRFPKNLIIRHSEPMIGQKPNKELKQLFTSTVDAGVGFVCPVKSGTETCDTYGCRSCWDKDVKNIDYRSH